MPHPVLIAASVVSGATGAVAAADAGAPFDVITPIVSTGLVGVFLLMMIFRIKIMPTYVYEDAKKEWERDRVDLKAENDYLKKVILDANGVYTQQVIPTLTRVLDAERELVEIRRIEQLRKA